MLPDTQASDLLTPEQFLELATLNERLKKLRESINKTNEMAAATGRGLRLLETFPLGLMANDISRIFCAHDQAEKAIAAAARERLERLAA